MPNSDQIKPSKTGSRVSEFTGGLDQICAAALLKDPEQPAIEFEKKWFTWGDVRRVADQLGTLIENSGAGSHAKVAFIARNRPSALAAFLGLLAKSCTIRMVYPFQSTEAIAKELIRVEPSVVVAAAEDFSKSVLNVLKETSIAAVALKEMEARTFPGFENTDKPGDPSTPSQVVLLTSGTTGPPKEFPLDYTKVARHFAGTGGMAPGGRVDKTSTTPALLYFPVSNISGLYSTLPPLLNGLPIVLLDRFSLEGWHEHLLRFRPKMSGLPPVGYKMVLDAGIPVEDLSCIEYLGAGAAPLDINVQRDFEERYGIPILLSYGATEFAGPVVAMTPDLWKDWGMQKLGSVGRPLPGMKLRVIDPETEQELPPGQTGIVEVVSSRIGPEWIRTSDLGVVDLDGFLFLQGRADGAIIRGGFKILPSTIEQGLLKNPVIAMAAVVGVPDERLGQVPAAAVVLKPEAEGVTAADVEANLREQVPATHIPTIWCFLEELPRTPSMKVDMPAVRSHFQE